MKEYYKKLQLFDYGELTEKAKSRAKSDYLESCRLSEDYQRDCEMWLEEDFPNSDLNVYFDLSSGQGDYFSICGKFDLRDFLPFWENGTEKEKRRMQFYTAYAPHSVEIAEKSWHDDPEWEAEEFIDYLGGLRDVDSACIKKYIHDLYNYIYARDKEFKEAGYNYFYEVTDEEVIDFAEANGWAFTENGATIWTGELEEVPV